MEWTVAVPWVDVSNQDNKDLWWIVPHLNKAAKHQLRLIPRSKPLQKWHERKSKFTSLDEWLVYWKHTQQALRETSGGVITAYPQLPPMAALQQMLPFQKKKPVVACIFTIGNCTPGKRQQLARLTLRSIDRFIVPSRQERQIYSQYLNLPIDRFEFIPYHIPEIEIKYQEETEKPFITALGSAHRDYALLFKAAANLDIPTIVATGQAAVEGLAVPSNVQLPFGISRDECFRLSQQARINVLPMVPRQDAPAGIVTVVEAMRMGRPIIASRCNGVEDYITHGKTGWLVEPNNLTELQAAIALLWENEALRTELGQAAKQYAQEHLSDEAGATALGRILDDVAQAYRQPASSKRVRVTPGAATLPEPLLQAERLQQPEQDMAAG